MESIETPRALGAVVFEGYDGSGKTTLLRKAANRASRSRDVVCIGRKAERQLSDIAVAIERPKGRLVPETDFLLRVALEVERWQLVQDALEQDRTVLCDRGIISLLAWPEYLGITVKHLSALLDHLVEERQETLNIVCLADFETCWSRIEQRENRSPKEQRGKEANRRFFTAYHRSVDRAASAGLRLLTVDTQRSSINASMEVIASEFKRLGVSLDV